MCNMINDLYDHWRDSSVSKDACNEALCGERRQFLKVVLCPPHAHRGVHHTDNK